MSRQMCFYNQSTERGKAGNVLKKKVGFQKQLNIEESKEIQTTHQALMGIQAEMVNIFKNE